MLLPATFSRLLKYTRSVLISGGSLIYFAHPARADESSIKVLTYEPLTYDLNHSREAVVRNLSSELKRNPLLTVSISDASNSMKPGSYGYVVARDRGLKIFEALVKDAVDPARINILHSKSSSTPAGDYVAIQVKENKTAVVSPKFSVTSGSADKSPKTASSNEFVINFGLASAEPLNLSETRFREFLSLAGQADRDAMVIEGYTDSQGNAAYNLALGDQRALAVFERLVRSGLPSFRILTQSYGLSKSSSGANTAAQRGADRRVVIRWTKNAAVAQKAVEASQAPAIDPVQPKPAAKPAPEVKAEVKPVAAVEPSKSSTIDLVPFVGAIAGIGELHDNTKPAVVYGLGIGKEYWQGEHGAARATLSYGATQLEAKDDSLSGPLKIRLLTLRTDYVFGTGSLRPFLGLGIGNYSWKGSIEQNSTQRRNIGDESDIGGHLAFGLDYLIAQNIRLSPEFTWTKIGGDFSASLMSGWLALRWGF